jgi:hypothetical protein
MTLYQRASYPVEIVWILAGFSTAFILFFLPHVQFFRENKAKV